MKEFNKILLEILRYTVMAVCIAIIAWFGYWVMVGFMETEISGDYEVTYPY